MKIRMLREVPGGMGGSHWVEKVASLPANAEAPAGAEIVPDETPEFDWHPVCQPETRPIAPASEAA